MGHRYAASCQLTLRGVFESAWIATSPTMMPPRCTRANGNQTNYKGVIARLDRATQYPGASPKSAMPRVTGFPARSGEGQARDCCRLQHTTHPAIRAPVEPVLTALSIAASPGAYGRLQAHACYEP